MARSKQKKAIDPALAASDTDLTFEAALHQLGAIVEQLESGELPLEQSLRLFEQGVGLAKHSQGILDAAETRVEQLLGIGEAGQPVTTEFDPEAPSD